MITAGLKSAGLDVKSRESLSKSVSERVRYRHLCAVASVFVLLRVSGGIGVYHALVLIELSMNALECCLFAFCGNDIELDAPRSREWLARRCCGFVASMRVCNCWDRE